MADPGVSGGDHAGQNLDFVVGDVPVVYPEELGLQADAPAVVLPGQVGSGSSRATLGQRFHQLEIKKGKRFSQMIQII